MVQVVLCSVSVICAGQRHAGFWKRAGWNGGADVGQPLMAPWGQIFANYTTNYTVGCCTRSQSKQQHHLNQTELIQPASESTPRHCTSPFMTHLQFSASGYTPLSSPSCWLHS